MPPLYIHDALPRSSHVSDLNRAVFLFLRFELFDERSDTRGNGGRKGVVLGLEALPNCQEPNASIASGIELGLALSGMGTVTILMPTDPIVDPVGHFSRGGDC
jgi:hypothetical protein